MQMKRALSLLQEVAGTPSRVPGTLLSLAASPGVHSANLLENSNLLHRTEKGEGLKLSAFISRTGLDTKRLTEGISGSPIIGGCRGDCSVHFEAQEGCVCFSHSQQAEQGRISVTKPKSFMPYRADISLDIQKRRRWSESPTREYPCPHQRLHAAIVCQEPFLEQVGQMGFGLEEIISRSLAPRGYQRRSNSVGK